MNKSNTKEWQESTDGWVSAMNKSKESKEQYQLYATRTEKPITYIEWLKQQNESTGPTRN